MNWQNKIAVGLIIVSFFSCTESKKELTEKEELINSFPKIQLLINEQGRKKLKEKRNEALKKGVLESNSKDLVAAHFIVDMDTFPCTIRLKGDWTTHLKEKKWSFRVELKNGKQWKQMTEFSLQNPKARDFLSEWMWHKMMAKERVLATQYLFCSLTLNGEDLGVYACEEHFTKAMLERNKKQLGLIVKMEEGELWADRVDDKKETKGVTYFAASEIDDYGGFKSIENYSKQRQKAVNMVYNYKFSQAPSSQVFVVEKLTKYFALVDLHRAYHSLFWHNQRFYYNPVRQKLEPIGYDGFTEAGPWLSTKKDYLGQEFWDDLYLSGYKTHLGNLFNNRTSYKEYIHQLKKVSAEDYIPAFLKETEKELKRHELFIQTEYKDYQYNNEYLLESAKKIRTALSQFNEKCFDGLPYRLHQSQRVMPEVEVQPIQGVSVMGFMFGDSIRVFNFHHSAISIQGVGDSEKISGPFPNKQIEKFFIQNKNPPQKDFYSPNDEKWLYYKVQGSDSLFKTEIKKELPPNYKLK